MSEPEFESERNLTTGLSGQLLKGHWNKAIVRYCQFAESIHFILRRFHPGVPPTMTSKLRILGHRAISIMSAYLTIVLLLLTQSSLVFSSTAPQQEKPLIFSADNYCPYLCVQDSDKIPVRGYMIDVVESIFHQLGIKIEIRIIPYDEAIIMAMKGDIDGVFGASPADAPRLVYPDQALGSGVDGFVTLSSSDWVHQGPESLQSMRYGTVKGYHYKSLASYVEKNQGSDKIQAISGKSNTTIRNLTKLKEGKIDAVLDNILVLNFYSSLYQLEEDIRYAGELEEKWNLWLGFSPSMSNLQEVCRRFNDEMEVIRQSGKLAFLLKKYGIKDWGSEFQLLHDTEKNRLKCD